MRELNIGTKRFTKVIVTDEPGAGGACHEYSVIPTEFVGEVFANFAIISFQNGPVKETGVNGIHQEDLLAIVIDRLESFQSGDFRCRENAIAITKIQEAMMWLNSRTQKRQNVGVEGTNVNHE